MPVNAGAMAPRERDWRLWARLRRAVARNVTAYLFLLPAIAVFGLFAWYPIVRGFVLSFQRVDLIHTPRWVGLDNFARAINDPLFLRAWRNTLQFTLLSLLLGYLLPVVLAVAVNEMPRGRGYFRLAFYLPVILPPMVSVLLWKWFYDPGPGLANTVLRALHLPPQPWLESPRTAMVSMVIQATWASAGSNMLLYLAALQGIPASLYEAAEIDGADLWRRLLHITLPQIRVTMLILFVLQVIASMQVFTTPFVMTDGGPVNSTLSVLMLVYRYAFLYQEFGAASALGLIFFVVLATLSMLYLRLTRRFGVG